LIVAEHIEFRPEFEEENSPEIEIDEDMVGELAAPRNRQPLVGDSQRS
jgi:hypothetical protein